jgi:glutamyl/glutaminyl-tRNA synthetase
MPEALINYLALLGWSPGDGQEMLPVADMARRFNLADVSHSAAVFDMSKLAWMNRHYMKEAGPARLVQDSARFFSARGWLLRDTDAARDYLASLLPMAVGSVDRLEEIPERVAFVFEWDAGRAAELTSAEPDGPRAVAAFAAEVSTIGPLDRDSFRAAATRAREKTGLKGRGLFHPIRVALTAAESGPELDLAVPAIDRGAALAADAGLAAVLSCAERLRQVAERVNA